MLSVHNFWIRPQSAVTFLLSPQSMPLAFTSYPIWRWTIRFWRNMRISPIATYLAYKSTGYADQGSFAGMTISDFVAVWVPYNNNGPPTDIMGRKKANVRYVRQEFFLRGCFRKVHEGTVVQSTDQS